MYTRKRKLVKTVNHDRRGYTAHIERCGRDKSLPCKFAISAQRGRQVFPLIRLAGPAPSPKGGRL